MMVPKLEATQLVVESTSGNRYALESPSESYVPFFAKFLRQLALARALRKLLSESIFYTLDKCIEKLAADMDVATTRNEVLAEAPALLVLLSDIRQSICLKALQARCARLLRWSDSHRRLHILMAKETASDLQKAP